MNDVSIKIKNTEIKISRGDIIGRKVDAIVSPEPNDLKMNTGVAAVIKEKGGEAIQESIDKIAPISLGEVVVTSAGALPAKYIFHIAILEHMQKSSPREKLQLAVKNCLLRAEELKVKSIVFPSLGLSNAKFPYDMCARIMLEHILCYLLYNLSSLELVLFNLFNEESFKSFEKMLNVLKEEYFIK